MDEILLSKISLKQFILIKYLQIVKSVLEIVRKFYEKGMFFEYIFFNNFLYFEKNKTIKFFDFFHTYNPTATGINSQRKLIKLT